MEILYSPSNGHISDSLIHKIICERGDVLMSKGILKSVSPENFATIRAHASYPSFINNLLHPVPRKSVISHSLLSDINRYERDEVVIHAQIAKLPSTEAFLAMRSRRVDLQVSLLLKFAGTSSLAPTPVIKRSIRYAAGKAYERSEILRACVLPPPEELSASQKKHNISCWSDSFSLDAKMIRESLLAKDNVELYLHLSTVVDDPSVTLSGNTILIASNNMFATEILILLWRTLFA